HGGPRNGPPTPQPPNRSSRPGEAVAPLDSDRLLKPRALADEREDSEPRQHQEREADPRAAIAARRRHAPADNRPAERHAERGEGEPEPDRGAGRARPGELGHEGVLHAVPADAEEAEHERQRYEEPRPRLPARQGEGQRAERGAAAGDDERRAAPPAERAVREHAQREPS